MPEQKGRLNALPCGPALIVVPAYNEESTIAAIVQSIRSSLPGMDLLVVDDGSTDSTKNILREQRVAVAEHLCNLGYGRAIQTGIKYALRKGYAFLITLDADGQHNPVQIKGMVDEFLAGNWDLLIGSRFMKDRRYVGVPFGRRIGMQLFSAIVRLVAQKRVYDTTSGLKVISRTAFIPLLTGRFVDFHAEAIVYLILLGYRVGEFPITVGERRYGKSMYSPLAHIKYPLKTAIMVFLGVLEANLNRRRLSK